MPRECCAVDGLATLVEDNDGRFVRNERRDRRRFFADSGSCVARAAFGDFVNFEAAKSELAGDVIEPLAIAFGQIPFRALLQAADGDDDDAHGPPLTRPPAI